MYQLKALNCFFSRSFDTSDNIWLTRQVIRLQKKLKLVKQFVGLMENMSFTN